MFSLAYFNQWLQGLREAIAFLSARQDHVPLLRRTVATGAAVLSVAGSSAGHGPPPVARVHASLESGHVIVQDNFRQPNGLVTDEFAHFNPGTCRRYDSSIWDMTSGALYVRNHQGWTGFPTAISTANSRQIVCNQPSNNTNSDIFRAELKKVPPTDSVFTLNYTIQRYTPTPASETGVPTGITFWVGYGNQKGIDPEYDTYAITIRNGLYGDPGNVVIKKKIPETQMNIKNCTEGVDNNGCYTVLKSADGIGGEAWASRLDLAQIGVTRHVDVVRQRLGNNSVVLTLYIDGEKIVSATDSGQYVAPYYGGQDGVRGDSTEFSMADDTIRTLPRQYQYALPQHVSELGAARVATHRR